ncbi:hypothetical protein bcgnr5390_64150 [Bacillus luti]|nr:hypothetical protein BC2903_62390 [Bacillus cereus]
MKEMFIRFNKNDSVYELSTHEGFLKITRDEKIIHMQFVYIGFQPLVELGLKSIDEIACNIGEYIEFCESRQLYKSISFESDEWEKQTRIYVKIKYSSQDGKLAYYKLEIDSIQGNMRGFDGDRLIEKKYRPFVKNPPENKPETTSVTSLGNEKSIMQQLVDHVNANLNIPVYDL